MDADDLAVYVRIAIFLSIFLAVILGAYLILNRLGFSQNPPPPNMIEPHMHP